MPKDGCNNMEKNKILRLHKAGNEVSVIAKHLRLTERIVQNMIDYHTKPTDAEPEPKPKKKKAKKKEKQKAAEEFEDDFD